MEILIVELSKYILIILTTLYTLYCFTAFKNQDKQRQNRIFRYQTFLMYMIHFICYLLLLIKTESKEVLFLYGAELLLFIIAKKVYLLVYKNLSRLVLNNMFMLLMFGFIMLTRLDFAEAVKQFTIACIAVILGVWIPFVIHKFSYLSYFGFFYAVAGIVLLALVLVMGRSIYGAKNWIFIGSFGLQPSEFVKILYVFFIASFLSKAADFKHVVLVSVLAGIHVLILVAEKDLGAALIFFVTYLVMLYVATEQPLYFISGLGLGSAAAVVAYRLFHHVRVRVSAWKDPWSQVYDGGWQTAQSLLAIGTGGWFGMGLGRGLPTSIPVSDSDFIFSAIAEEMGGIIAICIILICFSCYLMFVNIAMKMKHKFYKLTALGLGTLYGFQVFLTIGGATKCIPSTGVTLPLVSYGGSSILSTIIIFSIIQGLYVLNQKEGNDFEKE